MRSILCLLYFVAISCSSTDKLLSKQEAEQKVADLMEMFDRYQADDPSRLVPYEFNIPVDKRMKSEVQRIDSSVRFTLRKEYYQCIGEGNSKETVLQLAALPYTYKMKYCPFE